MREYDPCSFSLDPIVEAIDQFLLRPSCDSHYVWLHKSGRSSESPGHQLCRNGSMTLPRMHG